ncbi:MAG TPA: hypothetical protein VFL27_02210 [Candidatus Dormibacteraeota bacterium]|nr:hypothetical protein [Candidatus Dormibacteraeota bacterium]
MTAQSIERRSPARPVEGMGIALGAGLLFGALISLAAFLLARYGPTGGDWSFRGNGALAAYALVPALLAAGWTAVALHHRRRPWIALASGAGLVGMAVAAVDAALLPFFGPGADQTLGPIVLVALVTWTAVAPALALRLPSGSQGAPTSTAWSAGAAFLWAAGLIGGLLLVGLIFPAGS